MVEEDALKSSTLDDQTNINTDTTTNPNPMAHGGDENGEAEEGEIVGEDDPESSMLSKGLVHQPHPLEHSWTFWFDNPSAKARQAAWGISVRSTFTFTNVEEFWREQFDHGDEICGAVVNVRARQEKISIRTKNAANEAAQLSIGKPWKEFLDYNDTIGFIFHEDAKKLDRGAKNRYVI